MPLASRGYFADAEEAGFESVFSVDQPDPKSGRLSTFAKPYLPSNNKFHAELDKYGVGDTYREYKSYLPYLGTKGEFVEVGLDAAEGLTSLYL